MTTDECVCGHVQDEHDPRSLTCDIEGCNCGCYESMLLAWGDPTRMAAGNQPSVDRREPTEP